MARVKERWKRLSKFTQLYLKNLQVRHVCFSVDNKVRDPHAMKNAVVQSFQMSQPDSWGITDLYGTSGGLTTIVISQA